MKKWLRAGLILLFGILIFALIGMAILTRSVAADIVTHPPEERPVIENTPADYDLAYEDVMVNSEDGLTLYGWYVPGNNEGTVLLLHGSPSGRQAVLFEAAALNQAGFNVLLGSFRTHDECEGDLISYGFYEQRDIAAWYQYLLARPEIDPERIGIFGESMGGGAGILYTASHEEVRALATGGAFALTRELVETFIAYETPGLPKWGISVMARFIVFWAERMARFKLDDIDTISVIDEISPRPVLIIHGGMDHKIGPDSGHQLYQAAERPKELVFMEEAGHVDYEDFRPHEYSETITSFFTKYLLEE